MTAPLHCDKCRKDYDYYDDYYDMDWIDECFKCPICGTVLHSKED